MSELGTIVTDPGFDLRGTHVVAASAGTGKTYSIQSLYLRLILQGMTVQQILVVTFTEAATKELRERLRSILRDAARQLDDPQAAAPDERIAALVALVPPQDRGQLRHAVRTALLDFDLAAIHTIHGFCLRTLARFAFETGQSFDTTPVASSTEEIDRLCEDWWRANLYGARRERATLVGLSGLTPGALKPLARRLVAKPDAVPEPEPLELEAIPAAVRAALSACLSAAVDPVEPVGVDLLPEDGRLAWRAIVDVIARCREAAGAGAWEEAGAALCRAQDLRWESAPWRLPFDATLLCEACARIGDATKGKRKADFSLPDGRLACKSADLAALDQDLRRALVPLHDDILRIGDRGRFPHRGASGPHKTYVALAALDGYAHGTAVDAQTVVDAIRTVNSSPPRNIPGKRTVSLETVAPAWDEAATAVQARLLGLLTGAALHVKQAHSDSRGARDTLSFDDYLVNLRAALGGDSGPALREALRGEYKAALIDEFQDTDPVQYAIFNAIFPDDSEAPCFLVGDPKQAIYRFRNGDIETYVRATRKIGDVGRRHELTTNYRSEARLITAVNQLFGDTPTRRTFRRDEMGYDGRLAARGKAPEACLTQNGVVDSQPFKLWHFDGDGASKVPGLNSGKARAVWGHTAVGVRRLLDDDTLRIGDRRVQPHDIAVLVMTHGEAASIEAELVSLGIPVVRQGVQRVFDTVEAREFWVFLAAMVEPHDLRRVRAALTTRLLGVPAADVLAHVAGRARPLPLGWPRASASSPAGGANEEARYGLEYWAAFFGALRKTWDERGFAAAFNEFARRSALRARLASLPRGERSLTNVLQLAESIHRAAMQERLAPEGALGRFRGLLSSEDRGPDDEYELRLETDDNAVRIMTVFKSKGLEFPIVFVPTLWRRGADGRSRDRMLEYHEQERLVIETGTAVGKDQAIVEAFEENIRLAYVALTRAVHRTVLVWGNFKVKPEQHALAWLLGAEATAADLRTTFGDAAAVAVESHSWDEPVDATPYHPAARDEDDGQANLVLPDLPRVEKGFGHGSFSTLAPHAAERAAEADRDEVSGDEAQAGEALAAASPIFAFPAGATTGTCWHKVLEVLPFDADAALIREVSEEQLQGFGLTRRAMQGVRDERIAATVDMVSNVLRTARTPSP
jgi:ATP-dependent exoDNAse (exonuclease V) beta subunit